MLIPASFFLASLLPIVPHHLYLRTRPMNHLSPLSHFSTDFSLSILLAEMCCLGVHKSSNTSNTSRQFPIIPTDTCCWPAWLCIFSSVRLPLCFLANRSIPDRCNTVRLVLYYHFTDTPFGTKAFPPWLVFVLNLLEDSQTLSPQQMRQMSAEPICADTVNETKNKTRSHFSWNLN